MKGFANINTSEVFNGNPYVSNPHLMQISPYKEIYNRDKTKDKKKASNDFYAIWIMSCPDEDENKWIRVSEEKRKSIVAESHKVNWEDSLIVQGIKDYPEKCMGIAEKTLKGIQDKLLERDAFLKASPYTNDIYARDANGNYVSKGNTFLVDKLSPEKIDKMLRETAALYKELSEAQKLFALDKDNKLAAIRGGRDQTDMESGDLWRDYEV